MANRTSKLRKDNYTYIYLDNRKPGIWRYQDFVFDHQPLYVGRGVDDRIDDHLSIGARSEGTQKANTLNIIINQLKEDPIRFKLHENISYDESIRIEMEIIAFFGRRDNKTGILANLTNGGEGANGIIMSEETRRRASERQMCNIIPNSKRIDQCDLDGNFIKKWDSLAFVARDLSLTNLEREKIGRICHSKPEDNSYLGYRWKFDGTSPYVPKSIINKLGKKVHQYDLNGNFLATFDSCAEAEISVGSYRGSVSRAAGTKRKYANGFFWSYEYFEKYEIPPIIERKTQEPKKAKLPKIVRTPKITVPKKQKKPRVPKRKLKDNEVFQYSLTGQFVKKHSNIFEALSFVGNATKGSDRAKAVSNVIKRCRSKYGYAFGFQWRFDYEGESISNYFDSLKTGKGKFKRPIVRVDFDMNIIETFETTKMATKAAGKGNFRNIVSSGERLVLVKNSYWFYADKFEEYQSSLSSS